MNRFFSFGDTMNFRHMGGYHTAGGRTTAGDRLYRSGFLHLDTASDRVAFERLEISTVYDFRSPVERTKNTLGVNSDTEVVALGMLVASVENLWSMLLEEGLTAQGAEQIMIDRYRELAREEIPGYRAMFSHMLEREGNVLVMCSFGKDRAGIASALLLKALGVSDVEVREDYLISSSAYADLGVSIKKFEHMFDSQGIPFDQEIIVPILDARRIYLEAAWQVMENVAGTTDNFIARELSLNADARHHLVRRFTC